MPFSVSKSQKTEKKVQKVPIFRLPDFHVLGISGQNIAFRANFFGHFRMLRRYWIDLEQKKWGSPFSLLPYIGLKLGYPKKSAFFGYFRSPGPKKMISKKFFFCLNQFPYKRAKKKHQPFEFIRKIVTTASRIVNFWKKVEKMTTYFFQVVLGGGQT